MNCDLSELATALAEASKSYVPIHRDSEVSFVSKKSGRVQYSYASLGTVMEAIRCPLAEQGLALSHRLQPRDGELDLVTTLHHTSGQELSSTLPLGPAPKDPDGWKDFGSAVTYARRYSVTALLALSESDSEDRIHRRPNSHTSAPPKSPQPKVSDQAAAEVIEPTTPADPALIASGWRSPEDAQLWSADLVLPSGESLYRHSSHARNAYAKAREEYIASLPPEQRPDRMDPVTGEVASPDEKRRHFRVLNCYWVERCLARTRGEEYVLEPWSQESKPSGRVFDQPIGEDEAIHELPETNPPLGGTPALASLSRPSPT